MRGRLYRIVKSTELDDGTILYCEYRRREIEGDFYDPPFSDESEAVFSTRVFSTQFVEFGPIENVPDELLAEAEALAKRPVAGHEEEDITRGEY